MLMNIGLTTTGLTIVGIITGIPTDTITTGIIMAKVATATSTARLTRKLPPRNKGFGP